MPARNEPPRSHSLAAPQGSRRHPLLGVALIVLMGVAFAVLDTSVRWLGATLPVLLILAWRYATQAVVMAVWLALDRRRRLCVRLRATLQWHLAASRDRGA